MNIKTIITVLATALLMESSTPVNDSFTAAEQQQISIPTPGLFSKSNAFTIDMGQLSESEFSFPLPVGKAKQLPNSNLRISSQKGDAVKSMFDGTVRLSRKIGDWGNIIVVRHNNGLETVYGNNAQNLVRVGDKVKAGQTIAIVGTNDGDTYCEFAIMVNGNRINPSTIFGIRSHKLFKQTLLFTLKGNHVSVKVIGKKGKDQELFGSDFNPFENSTTFSLNLNDIDKEQWAYPLPGAHVISPYGGRGRRPHSGVDLKTKPNDNIYAAFAGKVTMAQQYYGYGNYIVIDHGWGLSTCYSHQSKNFVKVGQYVKAGELIGLTGRTGRATTEHLHFEVRYKGRAYNPNIIFNHSAHSLQNATILFKKNGGMSKK